MRGLPAPIGRAAAAVLHRLPESFAYRLAGARLGYDPADIPDPISIDRAPIRLLVAPANYAGQGHAWARSASRAPGVAAVNLDVVRPGGYSFPADFRVPQGVYAGSRSWSRAHLSALGDGFTHVLIEAELPILGAVLGHDLQREGRWLDDHGIARAYVSHGSDLRLPSRHAALDRWSPFRDPDWELVPVLERKARENAAFLRDQARPVFVPTPELLLDVPEATWLPIVVDPEQWAMSSAALRRSRPVVVHAPTNVTIKGTALVAPVLERLHDEGVIEYRAVPKVSHSAMPAVYEDADIVLEQFRLGTYATTAIEAMAAGRLVIGHVSEQVRAEAQRVARRELPILEGDPGCLEDVLRQVAADPEAYREQAESGKAYVAAVHDGSESARVVSAFTGGELPDDDRRAP
ncbi:glycosyltransferase [Microbacterium sp.]|uniref:glycosyltransferase n=1 Tax=Microbacterium sp. TaxID=51671 RepID=UPI0037CAB008